MAEIDDQTVALMQVAAIIMHAMDRAGIAERKRFQDTLRACVPNASDIQATIYETLANGLEDPSQLPRFTVIKGGRDDPPDSA